MDALLLLIALDQTTGYKRAGNFSTDAHGHITRDLSGQVYTGAQIIKTDRLEAIAEKTFSLNVLWDQMIAERTAFGLKYTGNWADGGTPAGIELAEGMLADV